MPDLTLTLIGSQLVSPDQRTRLYWGSDNALYRNTGTTFAPEKVSGSSGVDPVTITAGTGISVTNSGSVYTVAIDSTVVTNITANSPLSASRNGNQVTLSLNTSNFVSSVQVSGGLLTRSTSGSTTTIGLTTDAIGITLTGNNGITITKNAWNSFTITGPNISGTTVTAGTGISVTNSGSVYTVAIDSTVVTNITANSPLSASRNGNQVTLSLNTSNFVSSVQVSGGLLTRSTSGSTTTIGLTTDAIGITLTGNNGITITKNAWNSFTITGPNISGTTVTAGTGISVTNSGSASSGYTVSLDSDLIGTAGSTFFIYKDQLVVNGRNAVLQDTKMNVSATGSVISLNGSNAQVFILDPISAGSYTIVTSNIPENTAIVLIFTYVSGATMTFAGNVITDDLSDSVVYAMTFMNTDDTVYATMPVKLIS